MSRKLQFDASKKLRERLSKASAKSGLEKGEIVKRGVFEQTENILSEEELEEIEENNVKKRSPSRKREKDKKGSRFARNGLELNTRIECPQCGEKVWASSIGQHFRANEGHKLLREYYKENNSYECPHCDISCFDEKDRFLRHLSSEHDHSMTTSFLIRNNFDFYRKHESKPVSIEELNPSL